MNSDHRHDDGDRYYVTNPHNREVLVDTGHCRVERHPALGVVITGGLQCITLNDQAVLVPITDDADQPLTITTPGTNRSNQASRQSHPRTAESRPFNGS